MKIKNIRRKAFTLIELLVVIGILAVLALVVVFAISPAQLASQGRDQNRVSDVTTLNQDIALYHETMPAGNLGSSTILYVSLPDPTATSTAGTNCASLGLPTAPASDTYHCASTSNYRNNDGSGWIPVVFSSDSSVLLPTLPIDPINTTSSKEYYIYTASGSQYEILANPEAQKTIASSASSSFIQGTNVALEPTFPGTSGGSSAQNIWVADYNNNRVQEFNASGTYLSQFGSSGSGNGQFSHPTYVAIDASGNIWVVDSSNSRVEEFSSSGTYLSQFGSSGSGNGQFFNVPGGIAIDGSGNIWVSDPNGHRVEEFSSSGTYLSQFGSSGSGNGQFGNANGIAIDGSGNLWVVDTSNYRVEEFSSSGTYLAQIDSPGSGTGQLGLISTIAIDGSGNIWLGNHSKVGGISYCRVVEFSSAGSYLGYFGSVGSGSGQFVGVTGLAIDTSGNVWASDGNDNRVEEFSSSRTYLSQFGSSGSGNGQFSTTEGIVFH